MAGEILQGRASLSTQAPQLTQPDRRIVLIAGAGASTNLGANGARIPMMAEWATALVDTIGADRAAQIGLSRDLDGSTFEQNLGDFLAFERALPDIEKLLWLGTPGSPQRGVTSSTTEWLTTARNAITEIHAGLRQSLWDNFGSLRIDREAAEAAYRQVVEWFEFNTSNLSTRLALVTTNYNPGIEMALGSRVFDGFTSDGGYQTPVYQPQSLLGGWSNDALGDRIPLVHLHGAVGWYERPDGAFIRLPADQAYDNRRSPGLLLPDSRKTPTGFTAAHQDTWLAFEQLMERATHVVFIGHGLNDAHIVKAVRDAGKPTAVMAYTGPADAEDGYRKVPQGEKQRIWSLIPNAHIFPGEIGSKSEVGWTDRRELDLWVLK